MKKDKKYWEYCARMADILGCYPRDVDRAQQKKVGERKES